jgi:hypothetical protein
MIFTAEKHRTYNSPIGQTCAKIFRLRLTTLRELTMIRLMNQLTDKPGWDEKESRYRAHEH